MSIRSKTLIYLALLTVLATLNAIYNKQPFVELYMRWRLLGQPIVVSFTTTPTRLNKIQPTVKTILKQNLNVDAIYLNVPYFSKRDNAPYTIPDWLRDEKKITILRTQDYGPGTKLLGLLEQTDLKPNTIIITVDDDVFYPNNLFLQLAYKAMQNPNYAVGISGVDPDYDSQGLISTKSQMGTIERYDQQGFVSILQGYGGIAYRRSFFKEDIFDLDQMPICRNTDDMFFSFYLAKNAHPRLMLRNDYINIYPILWYNSIGTDTDALHKQTPKPAFKNRDCVAALKAQNPGVVF